MKENIKALWRHINLSSVSLTSYVYCRNPLNPGYNVLPQIPQDGFLLHLEVLKNVDGAVSREGRKESYSAIARNETGHYMGSSTVLMEGLTDPEILETLACREGLSLATDLNISSVTLAFDCKNLITDLAKGSEGNNARLNKGLLRFNSCAFVHEGRRSNHETHLLVKHTLSLSQGRHV